MTGVAGVMRKVRWSLAQRGVRGTLRFALGRLGAKDDREAKVHPFDLQHGTDTSGLIGGADLATGHEHDIYNTAYYGMSPSRFLAAMKLWMGWPPLAPVGSYTLVDLGCGKGRAVLMGSQLPVAEVIGVEIHPELAAVAERNWRAWQSQGRNLVAARVVCQDATEFEFPVGPCLVYLFNPFARPVVELLLRRIAASFRDRPGLLDVIYFNPEAGGAFEAQGGFELLWSGTLELSPEDEAADLVASPDDLCSLYRWVGVPEPVA